MLQVIPLPHGRVLRGSENRAAIRLTLLPHRPRTRRITRPRIRLDPRKAHHDVAHGAGAAYVEFGLLAILHRCCKP